MAANTDWLIGGTGSSTIFAGNVASTLLGGYLNNYLVADTLSGAKQSLWGGNNNGSSLYGNTLFGGTGLDTLRSGTGYNTLISGSQKAGTTLKLAANFNSISPTLTVTSTTGLAVGQMLTGPGIAEGTSIRAISGNTITLSSINGFSATAAKGSTTLTIKSASGLAPAGLAIGLTLSGTGLASGTTITAINGSTLTLSQPTSAGIVSGPIYAVVPTGSQLSVISQVLIGGGISNSLVAGAGNDSLSAVSGNSTLIGGAGRDTLKGSNLATASNWLQSGSTGKGNTLLGGPGLNTLVAGSGGNDSIVVGITAKNLLLVNDLNKASFASNSIALSTPTLYVSQNTLGLALSPYDSLTNVGSFDDSLLGGVASTGSRFLGKVQNLTSNSNRISLGQNAQKAGVLTLVSGTGSKDTLSAAGYTSLKGFNTPPIWLDASNASNSVSMVGTSLGNNNFLGSKGGYDTLIGKGSGNLFIQQSANLGSVVGGSSAAGNTIAFGGSSLTGTSFNNVSNIQTLSLTGGSQYAGSLQGSGITKIIHNSGLQSSNTLSLNVYASATVTKSGATTLVLRKPTAQAGTTLGFKDGMVISGPGIDPGTTIKISKITDTTITLNLSKKTTGAIIAGTPINGWLSGTVDDSTGIGLLPNASLIGLATGNLRDAIGNWYYDSLGSLFKTGVVGENFGKPDELVLDLQSIPSLVPKTENSIIFKGDVLTGLGNGVSLVGASNPYLPPGVAPITGTIYSAYYDLNRTHALVGTATNNSLTGGPVDINVINPAGDYATYSISVNRYISNTLISGAYSDNTLVGGGGNNLYQIVNPSGFSGTLPYILNPQFTTPANGIPAQSASTIQFTGNSVTLGDKSFPTLKSGSNTIVASQGAAQIIKTANGNNLIFLGNSASDTGIQSIIGGLGSDTFTTASNYGKSVYFNASRNSGRSRLSSGSGDDTLLGSAGSSTLIGGDGSNSLIGGNGVNLIKSGIGSSTLDSGYGISTLQADGGTNIFVVRNRFTRILNPDSLNPDTGTIPEVGIVNSYVNFDPIQGSPNQSLEGPFQFAPQVPDNSPSITKSPSFASSDLSSFYNLQYFNLLGTANYGVGNALDNSITAASEGALVLGMGGNNTLVSTGDNSSLYGDSNSWYASPDLYAYAPTDTRNQEFIDGVMGSAGNNSLVAKGAGSYLDGGAGYDDGLFDGSGANTLIATGGNNTVIQSHESDLVSLTGSSNTVITSVDLTQAPNNVSNLIVNVTPQLANSGGVTFAGQRMTASYAAVAGATGGYTDTNSITAGSSPSIIVNDSVKLQVAYGISDGTIYGTDNVPDANLPLTVGTFTPDPNNSDKLQVNLSWSVPTIAGADGQPQTIGQTMGYVVNYQTYANLSFTVKNAASAGSRLITVADISGINVGDMISGVGIKSGSTVQAIDKANLKLTLSNGLTQNLPAGTKLTDLSNTLSETPFLTYLRGTSQDLTGTTLQPKLNVDNLPTSFTDPYTGITYNSANSSISYNFKVTAQATVLPAFTNFNGDLIAQPVSLLGGQGNDVIYGGLLNNVATNISNTRPVLTNRPNPLENFQGLIPAPYGEGNSPLASNSGLFPVYESGGLGGNDLLIAPVINDGSGNNFTAYQYINNEIKAVEYSGLCTLQGGQGSDTFYVANGGTSISVQNGVVTTDSYDYIIKYGKETAAGQHNLVLSGINYLSLSDTTVNQGQFIDQAWAPYGNQYLGGNRLDNTFISYVGGDTLLGAGGRDFLDASKAAAAGDALIGGTAYGLDNISRALADFNNGLKNSIYRDTDPVPVNVNGPGAADNSQYWMVNGRFDPLRNSDTLLGATIAGNTLDGGAGNDSMVGGEKNDLFYISSVTNHWSRTPTGQIIGTTGSGIKTTNDGDCVVGGGGNDTIVGTASDLYWSGIAGATTARITFDLGGPTGGDNQGGQSISNIILQAGDPIALGAIGNLTSTGNAQGPGSNILVGNEFSNTLDGAGVGGASQTGTGIDVLTGRGGADYFIVSGYTASSSDKAASFKTPPISTSDSLSGVTTSSYELDPGKYRTDKDYVVITDMQAVDKIIVPGVDRDYLLGKAPSSFGDNNIGGSSVLTSASTDFGIYTRSGNLVAQVKGIAVGTLGPIATISATAANSGSTVTARIDGQGSTAADPNHLGGSNFFLSSSNSQVINSGTALNFLGMGPMYELEGSAFASRVN
jgi:hypothetical protein